MIGDETLTEIEQDALAEIANMAVARAATSLRQMVGEQVLLSVASVSIVTRRAASKLVGEEAKLIAVRQSFSGPFAGNALLIFPQEHSFRTHSIDCRGAALPRRRDRSRTRGPG